MYTYQMLPNDVYNILGKDYTIRFVLDMEDASLVTDTSCPSY